MSFTRIIGAFPNTLKRPEVRRGFIYISMMIVATFGSPGITRAVQHDIPFCPGEKLSFKVRWAFVPAGEIILEVQPFKTINGVKAYHFVMSARTYPFIDPFYKLRERIDAYSDIGMTHSILYEKKQEGKSKRDVVVRFDWEKQEALYSSFDETRDPISIMPGSFDPLSIFYALRLYDLKENLELETPVTDGKKCVRGKARVLRREKIDLDSGSYDTYLLEPELEHIGGVFKKSRNARLRIWVTADERHIPVRIESKVVVGSFVAELVSVENTHSDSGKLGGPYPKEPPLPPASNENLALAE